MVKRKTKNTLIVLISIYIMIAASLYFLQDKILFRPSVLAQDYNYSFDYNFEELFLKTDKDAVINALHFKVDNPKGVIVYFHGNAGDLSRWGMITEYFVEKQYDVLVMDYRTFGKSTGALSEEALYTDAQFCYDYIKTRYTEDLITVYGRSLGTGIATFIASKNQPKQLVLETPYFSIQDVAKHRFPIFPVKYLMNYKLPTNEFIAQVICPISIVHGTDDMVVPFSSGEKLYKTAPKEKMSFIIIEGGSHNNLITYEAYHKHINKVLP
ncbi:alpha/beta hydrolase [Lacinutrix iliipiscaria]|uniref:Alpha/beta hydrolase n=1 Tax=Lacinutrix iliipiscaria TaxID=1230532 RepID=A0ABW5WSX8_9FLAO